MRTYRCASAQSLNLGFFTDCVLDPVFYGQNGMPAIVASPDFSTSPLCAVNDVRLVYAGTWASGVTVVPNSSVTLTYTGFGARIVFNTGPHQGIAFVTLDGSPRLCADTFAVTVGTINYDVVSPSGGSHTLVITYFGDIDQSTPNGAGGYGSVAIGAVGNVSGTSVAPLLTPTLTNRGTTINQTWAIAQVTDGQHVSINGSGSYALGTTVTGVIGGVGLVLATGMVSTGDSASFQTFANGISLAGFYVAGADKTDAQYASPVVRSDSSLIGAIDNTKMMTVQLPNDDMDISPLQWILVAWEENPVFPIRTGRALTGNTSTPDTTWAGTPAADVFNSQQVMISHDSYGHGNMALNMLPRGVYAEVYLNIPQGGYVRNLRFYGYNPDTDPDYLTYPPIDDADDLSRRLYEIELVSYAMMERDPLRELLASFAITTSTGQYLDNHYAEWATVRPYGLDDSVASALLRFFSQQKQPGATAPFINRALSLLLGPNIPFSVLGAQTTTTQWVLGQSLLGVDTFLGPTTIGALQAIIGIPVRNLTIPPQIIQNVINFFIPLGVSLTLRWI